MKADMAMCSATEALKSIYPASLGKEVYMVRHVGGGLRCDCDDCSRIRRQARNRRKAARRKMRGK